MYNFNSCLVLAIFHLEMRLDLGGMLCMRSCMAGGYLLTDLEIVILLLFRYILFIVCESLYGLCHYLGRGQISVKPTGHARFSAENFKTYFRKYKLISKEINWIKDVLFYLFIIWL